MMTDHAFEIFLVTAPGLETALRAEANDKGFQQATVVPGGVTILGGWPDVWRANLELRGASRILARIDTFHVLHLAQLDKRSRKVPWADILRPDIPVQVEASCKGSKIYHSGAAAQRIATAIHEELGAPISKSAAVVIKARIDNNQCTLSIDTSGEALHKRNHKEAVNRAPMRENLAALFLRQCRFDGTEPVLDPMCGSGSFVIEAAEIACGLLPGRSRSFAFEHLASFDPGQWQHLRDTTPTAAPSVIFYGRDRDDGAIEMSRANANRAGVAEVTQFARCAISDLIPPDGQAGLVILNPPYGGRIGKKDDLRALYQTIGKVMTERFSGWRVGIITDDAGLAKATGLPFKPTLPPVLHGGIRVRLYQTGILP
jgi:putative N6-adenine-specific DNA methylase